MIDLYIGYGLFILYVFCVVGVSAVLWILMYLCGLAVVGGDTKSGVGSGRKYGLIIFIVASIAQWVLLAWCDHVVRVMWHSLPPLPSLW